MACLLMSTFAFLSCLCIFPFFSSRAVCSIDRSNVFLLPYFAYIFSQDIPFSRTILDIGNLLWPLAIFAVLLYEDKKEKLGIWCNPSLGVNLKTVVLSLALGVLWQLIILLLTSLFDAPNTDPREAYTLAPLILHIKVA